MRGKKWVKEMRRQDREARKWEGEREGGQRGERGGGIAREGESVKVGKTRR